MYCAPSTVHPTELPLFNIDIHAVNDPILLLHQGMHTAIGIRCINPRVAVEGLCSIPSNSRSVFGKALFQSSYLALTEAARGTNVPMSKRVNVSGKMTISRGSDHYLEHWKDGCGPADLECKSKGYVFNVMSACPCLEEA